MHKQSYNQITCSCNLITNYKWKKCNLIANSKLHLHYDQITKDNFELRPITNYVLSPGLVYSYGSHFA